MQHPIDWSRPAKLTRANSVVPFGDGYRQITGPTIAEGSVEELLRQGRGMPLQEQNKLYISNENGVPLTLDEVEQQAGP